MKNEKLIQRIQFFESIILDFFKKAGREHLPWRREGITAYEVWVSEIMLQQTQVSRVLFYYEKFLTRFPGVETLARASWEEFLPYYAGLGYYARGRNMLRAAKVVVEEFGGEFPRDVRVLETLPGIGKYTAAAIASFAYNENAFAWDTNLRRVVGRFFFGTKQVKSLELEKIGEGFSSHTKSMNAALMDFGSAICLGKPKCGACPLASKCRYKREKGERELGMKNPPETLRVSMRAGKELGEENKQPTTNNRQRITNNGQQTIMEKTQTKKIQWREARVEVILHENHKKYFSSSKKLYRPFLVPSSHNTRSGIKSWFRDRYELEVSVRPPHKRLVIDGIPTMFVNAQILLGAHMFVEFPKEAVLEGTPLLSYTKLP